MFPPFVYKTSLWTRGDTSSSCRVIALECSGWRVEARWKKKDEKFLQNVNTCPSLTRVYILFLICSSIKSLATSTHITWSICLILSCSSPRITRVQFTRACTQRKIIFWMNNYITSEFDFFLPKLRYCLVYELSPFFFFSHSNWRSIYFNIP